MDIEKGKSSHSGKRISVIGVSGCGKSTFARELAKVISAPAIELDSLHWEPNWTEASIDVFRERVRNALATDSWVCDGNYSKVRDLIWASADTIVWLDYSFFLIMYRLVLRTAKRILFKEKLWGNNQESFGTLFTNNSILLWAFKTYFRHKVEFPKLLKESSSSHLRLLHLKSPAEADRVIRNWI